MPTEKTVSETIARQKWPMPHHIHFPKLLKKEGWLWDLVKNFLIGGTNYGIYQLYCQLSQPCGCCNMVGIPDFTASEYILSDRERSPERIYI